MAKDIEQLFEQTRLVASDDLRKRVLGGIQQELAQPSLFDSQATPNQTQPRATWIAMRSSYVAAAVTVFLWLHLSWSSTVASRTHRLGVAPTVTIEQYAERVQRLVPELDNGQ